MTLHACGVLPYTYDITKFGPADRDENGYYTGAQSPISDHGPVEAAYLEAAAAFAEETGVRELAIREPEIELGFVNFGLEPPIEGHGLAGLFPPDLTGYHDGAVVPVEVALQLVRAMLRDNGAWCRLEAEGQLTVHVGYDQHLVVASIAPCEAALTRTRELGLFPERIRASPHEGRAIDETHMQRPADDEFWARLRWCVTVGQAALLDENPVRHLSRWHELAPGTLDAVRAQLGPRALLHIWPDLPSGDNQPLMTAVLPDSDGIMRARWGTDPAPGDQQWALLKTLHPGQAMTGTVTQITDSGIIHIDIGGVTATINPAELSERHSRIPADVVAAGQQVTVKILRIDMVREQVSAALVL